MPGALVFGAATSDRATTPAATAHNNLTAFTAWGWMYPTAANTNRRLMEKLNAGGSAAWALFRDNPTASDWAPIVLRATTNSQTRTSDFTLNAWQLMIVTYDEAATQGVKIFRGTLGVAPVECAYGTTANGSGATNTSDGTLIIGNSGGSNRAFDGRISMAGLFPAVLSLTDMKSLWRQTRKTLASSTAVAFARLGKNGADGIDYTGLAWTVTGATQGDGVPLLQSEESDDAFGFENMSGVLSQAA